VGLVPWAVILFTALLGLASAVPLVLKAARHGWPVVLVTPTLAFVRAGALVLGIGWGIAGLSRVLKTRSELALRNRKEEKTREPK
jgi:F0F1-type ATP synthase assembly protein I